MLNPYDRYDEWKGWNESNFMQIDAAEHAYFDHELGAFPIEGKFVLEIGFGRGNFLAWARAKGATLYGTELSTKGRELAAGSGVEVLPTNLQALSSEMAGRFALVAAFDVLEHLSVDETRQLMTDISGLLSVGGRFVARFPNGQSPFGRVYQAGDVTHKTTLSAPMLLQIVAGLPLEFVSVGEDLPVIHGSWRQRLKQRTRRRVRTIAGTMIKRTFGFEAPLGVNVVITLARTTT